MKKQNSSRILYDLSVSFFTFSIFILFAVSIIYFSKSPTVNPKLIQNFKYMICDEEEDEDLDAEAEEIERRFPELCPFYLPFSKRA